MLDKTHFKDLTTYILIIGLFILTIIILRPVITSIIYGLLLGYIFYPIFKKILKKLKNKNLSAFLVCLSVLVLIFIIAFLLLTTLSKQIIELYLSLQKLDMVNLIRNILPSVLSSSEASETIVSSINTSISGFLANYLSSFSKVILNIPIILLQLFVVVFVFFFILREGDEAVKYVRSLSPLRKETNERFSKQLQDVTNSVLIGQIVVGILQGIIAGIGYFIFGVPNALLLTFLTILIGVIPIIGPWLVWIPIDVYLFATGKTGSAIGLLIYGVLLINWIDALIRPLIVSRKTKINSGIILIGMIGGLLVFGVLGLIIGPLVLSYVLLVLELYRKKTNDEDTIFIKKEN